MLIKKVNPNDILKGLRINKKAHSIVLHCSASDAPEHDNPETIREWHLKKGYKDIGYHFYIDQLGNIFKCRDMTTIPAAQLGYNTNTIAICLGGLSNFTENQFHSLEILCYQLQEKYNGLVNSKRLRILGHREIAVNPRDCPVFDYGVILNLLYEGKKTVTARWGRGKKSKDFEIPLYYLRPKKIQETRTGKGVITATGGAIATTAKVATTAKTATAVKVAAGGATIAGAISESVTTESIQEVSDFVSVINSLANGIITVLSYIPWWLAIGLIFAGLAIAFYARYDDIVKGDIKRIFDHDKKDFEQ